MAMFSGRCSLSEVVRQGQEAHFHRYFVRAAEQKPFEVVIVFDLGKDRLHVEAPLLPFLYPPFCFQSLLRL